jgi:hypothetical protein
LEPSALQIQDLAAATSRMMIALSKSCYVRGTQNLDGAWWMFGHDATRCQVDKAQDQLMYQGLFILE